jgi:hypothetical protein
MSMLAAVVIGCLAQDVDNPAYQAWAKVKPGTAVTIKTETDSGASKSESVKTYVLESIDDKGASLKVTGYVVMNGAKIDVPEGKETVAAKLKKEEPDPKVKIEEGDEEVEIVGRKVKCHWTKRTGEKKTEKRWTTPEIPGGIAKEEKESGGAKTRIWVTALDVK